MFFSIFASKQRLNHTNMDITNILGALTGNDAVNTIAEKFNIDSNQVSSVITNALPSFLGAMQQNASTEGGAAALAKALGDHAGEAGNIINNLKGADLTDGSKILSHIFGGNLSSVISGISKKSGVASNGVSNILAAIAPSILALLGKGQQGVGKNMALAGMLGAILGGSSNSSNSNSGGLGSILGGLGKIFGN